MHRDNVASHGVPPRAGFEREIRDAPARMEVRTGPVFVVYACRAPSAA